MINEVLSFILSFKVYVMLPILMFTLCMIIRIHIAKALKYSITLGIGFFGIFMVFDVFVEKMGPVIEAIATRTGSDMTVLDVGWPPLAAASWTFSYVPLLILLFVGINFLMLAMKWTNIINIDIWNFWHFIFLGQIVYFTTNSPVLAIVSALSIMVITQKLADWSAQRIEEMSKIPGIAITTLSGVTYYPFALLVDRMIDKIPKLRDINGNPEYIKEKLGVLGDPLFIGLLIGSGLGIAAGYDVKGTADLAISVAAVVFLLPRMGGVLGEGLIPISNEAKKFILRKFPKMEKARIGMDLAVVVGLPANVATGILIMPLAVVLALILPGVKFIPLGDLPNLIPAGALIVIATRGNIFRSIIAFIPVIIGKLYSATALAPLYTKLAIENNITTGDFSGDITSFLDGGNLLRNYLYYLFSGHLWTLVLIPVIIFLGVFTYRQYLVDEKRATK